MQLKAGTSSVPAAISVSGATITLDPSADLAHNTLYTATVGTAVTDQAGNHLAAAASWTFRTVSDTTAPAAPAGLSATSGDGTVTLSWAASASGDVAGYRIHCTTSAGVQPGTSNQVGTAPGTSNTDNTASNGTTYYYVVVAVDAAGNASGASNEASATPGVNEIVAENQLAGTERAVWDVSGAGDTTLLGYGTLLSVDQGGTVQFKIDDDTAAPYIIEIYRLGWYGG